MPAIQDISVTFSEIRDDISNLVRSKGCGPILIRLAWHDAGTYDKASGTGGSRACMYHRTSDSEYSHGANAGLHIAQDLLQPIKDKYPGVSYADFWAFAACVAIEVMGGPHIAFRPGRVDAKQPTESAPDGRLPNARLGASHLREVFYRQGFTDQDIVALSGAHTVGRCHVERSGFEGPWTAEPLKFDNSYFVDLLKKTWQPSKSSKGEAQFSDGQGNMMLISDLALIEDENFRKYSEKYANSQEEFFSDFAKAFQKLLENGVQHLGAEI